MEGCVQSTPCVNVPEPACVLHDYYLIDSSRLSGVSTEHKSVLHLEINTSPTKKRKKLQQRNHSNFLLLTCVTSDRLLSISWLTIILG